MTAAQITKELDQQRAIHDTALQIVELIDVAMKQVAKLGGNADEAREKIVELVTTDL